MEDLKYNPLFWIGLALIMLTQSTWLFLNARQHSRYPWFWGIWGLIQCPWPLVIYLLIVRKDLWKKKK